MWSAYSTAKLFFLLLLVDASFGRYLVYTSNFSSTTTTRGNHLHPYGNVTIKLDIKNKTCDSYTANVTIFSYLKNHEIVGPWELGWTWREDEILLNTVGAKGTQHGSDPIGVYTWSLDSVSVPLNSVIFVDSPSQTNCCKGSVIPSCFREANFAKSSTSFQISVGRAGKEYHHVPPFAIHLTTPTSEYICGLMQYVKPTPGYLDTWRSECYEYST